MELKNLKRDTAAIETGEWVDSIPQMGDLKLKVRGLTCQEASDLKSQKEREIPVTDRNRDGSLKSESSIRIIREVLFEVILLDWANLTSGKKEIKYSKEMAEKLLMDPDMTPFADAVTWASSFVDRKRATDKEAVKGN